MRPAATTSPTESTIRSTPPLTGRYVALGSSFAAGTGIGTDISNGCGRSARNYPHLIATRLGLDLTDVTCAAATTDNLLFTPQGDHPPQLEAVTADTRLATVTAGGNDLNYSGATLTCMAAAQGGQPCTQLPSAEETTQAAETLRVNLGKLLAAVVTAAPQAQVYLVGYPRVFPDHPVTCAGNIIGTAESERLAAIGVTLQETFRLAAADARVHFLDVYTASTGHDVCAEPANRWVDGSDATGIPYHPNANGATAIAALLVKEAAGQGRDLPSQPRRS